MASKELMGMSSMQLIGAAIVVIVVIGAGVVLFTGHGSGTASTTVATTVANNGTATTVSSGSNGTTAMTTAATTIPTQQNNSLSLQSLVGENVSLNDFNNVFGGATFSKASTLNATYNYKYKYTLTGSYAYTINGTGTTVVEKYYNDSRITTTGMASGETFVTTLISNSSSKKNYVCTSFNGGSTSCSVSATNISLSGSTGGQGFVGSEAGSNTTVSGYYNNIAVSSSSYNGQPCTLVTGNIYVNAQAKNGSTSAVLQGTTSACVSTQDNTWLSEGMLGTMTTTSKGTTIGANMNYSMVEVSLGATPTQSITALPGPVSG